jgi:quercetin dioxygenase-like cupin family protein
MLHRCWTAAAVALVTLAASPACAQNAAPAPDAAAPAQQAAPAKGYPAEPLLSTSTTVVGELLRCPTSGAAHVTAAIVTLAPGERTILHRHGVPMFAYILDGEITVDYGTHGKRTYRKGASLMEAMHVAHFGENTGTQPVRLIAVYMGAARARDVIPVK